MNKKKILVWETLSTVSGGQKMTLTIMDLLKDSYDFCCLIPEEGMLSNELKNRDIEYYLLGNQSLPTGIKGKKVIFRYGWMSLRNIVKSVKVIKKYKPDYLYAPGPASLPWSAVCGMLTRKPVIWHLHHMFLDGMTKKLLNLCGSWNAVKCIVAVSNCVGSQIMNEKAHSKVKILYNPIDIEKYQNGNPEKIKKDIEETLNCKIEKNKTIVLTHIGAITKNKCQDFFVRVIAELKEMGLPIIGLMIGDVVTEEDKGYKEKILDYIHENSLENNIYMPGFRKDIADILKLADCVLIPSSEGLPLVALEAMAAKCNVVAIDSNGSYELLSAANTGAFYSSTGTSEDAAKAVVKILSENDEAAVQRGYDFCKGLSKENYSNMIRSCFKGE